VKVSVINFAITASGLEEQMLAQIVALENPQMEEKKLEIVSKNAEDRKTLIQIEDSILKALSSTQGNIDEFLKDESLINELSNSKKTSQEINKRVEESKITEQQIDETREGYRPVANRAAQLFFCIIDFALIDPMYQYSLQWFVRLFVMSIESSTPSTLLEERLLNINDHFTYSLYENVCRSLFEKHKLLFSFVLTIKIKQGEHKINDKEWRYLLSGPSGDISVPENPTDWIPDNQWPDVYRQFFGTGHLEAFKDIQEHFMTRAEEWKRIFDSPKPQDESLPEPYHSSRDLIQKIIIIKNIRSDKVIPAIQNYVSTTMGERFIIAPTFDLSKCYRDSSVVTPLIFVLSSGSDPVADFLKFANESGMGERYKSISLGQGQGKKAKALVEMAYAKGFWVLLQNCHLSISWMPQLELICEGLNTGMHKDFRLWLTSMPSESFSIPILQNSIKMTLEPPQGLRNNLLRTYRNLDEKDFSECKKTEEYKRLLFGFCLFHAIIQDRRKFGPIGWNIAYEFTNEDLMVCRKQLRMLLDEYEDIPYKVLNFLGAEINYGGRVTDDKDVRLITTIIQVYVNSGTLQVGHKFSESGLYRQPEATTIEEYIEYLEKLPLNPSPEAFGMHDNAEITNSQSQTAEMLESILSVQPKTGAGTGKSREEVIG
jgi:dynein heavy chain, axonemal